MSSEQEILSLNLDSALADAVLKTGKATEANASKAEGFAKRVWAAAEACEYASLIYALAHDLEESKTQPVSMEGDADPVTSIRRASQFLSEAQTLRRQNGKQFVMEGYERLRQGTDILRSAYLALTRPSVKSNSGQSKQDSHRYPT